MKNQTAPPEGENSDQREGESSLDATACCAIFVVVLVSYDYYRFQDNLGATVSIEKAREIAAREAKKRGYGGDLPVIEDAEISQDMNYPETRHIWIESFPQNARAMPPATESDHGK